ncbi:acyltransferase [Chitinophaga filiformis]|uniref:acyltransferase family protein n=1 Tax=Chitinophaga filiformis TaxID=104663 RepID=UPI001F413D96|nr:acyltransferase [Chitinophaga filiformis]MCF6405052.1 acyltransferase [Chitinophaga filiformis]
MQTATVEAPAIGAAPLRTARQHFEILDGLRGIAAIVVVIFHFLEIVYTDYSKNFAGHGFLAVDFFFCLSGFVIAYAYDDRIEKMGLGKFLKARLIRLHPLVILGSVLGLLALFFDPFATAAPAYSAGKIALIFLMSVLVIPFPVMADRFFNLFGLNAPAWSLFWEYVANIVYGFILWKLDKRILLVMAVIAAAWLTYVGHKAGNVMGGWGKDNFRDGAARISFSFLAGMLVYRYNFIIKNKLGFTGLTVLLVAALLMPWFKLNWLAEVLVVVLYFPLLIALGAGSTLRSRMEGICNFSGKISYPLYMTHYMVMWAFANYNQQNKPDTGTVAWIVSCGVIVLIAFAYVVMVWFDTPVRKYLSEKSK